MNPFKSSVIIAVGAAALVLWTLVAVGFAADWWVRLEGQAVLLALAAVATCAVTVTVLLLALRVFAQQFITAGRVYSEAYQSGFENGRAEGRHEQTVESPRVVDLRLAARDADRA